MDESSSAAPSSAQEKRLVKTILWVNERRVQRQQRELNAAQEREKKSEDRLLEAGKHLQFITHDVECRRQSLLTHLKSAVNPSSSLQHYGKQVTVWQGEVVDAKTEMTDSQSARKEAAKGTAEAKRLLKIQQIRQEKWLIVRDQLLSRSGG